MLNHPSSYLSFLLDLICSKTAEIWETDTGGTVQNYFQCLPSKPYIITKNQVLL